MEIIVEWLSNKVWWWIKLETWSRDLKSWLVKGLLNQAQICSAGLSSGQYGGKKIKAMLFGILSFLALWKAPLSSTISLSSFGSSFEKLSKKIWKVTELQKGSSNKNLFPLIGEKAPKR